MKPFLLLFFNTKKYTYYLFRDCLSCNTAHKAFQESFDAFHTKKGPNAKKNTSPSPNTPKTPVQTTSKRTPLQSLTNLSGTDNTPLVTPHVAYPQLSITGKKRKPSPSEVTANAATIYESANKHFKTGFAGMELSDALVKVGGAILTLLK